jgi:hypothetical protein
MPQASLLQRMPWKPRLSQREGTSQHELVVSAVVLLQDTPRG